MRVSVQRLMAMCALCTLLAKAAGLAGAAEAPDTATDPALEARVNAVAAELRCLVCQNQSLAASHQPLAIDLNNQVRAQLQAGHNADDVVDYMTERCGDYVRYRPALKPSTVLLWIGPCLMVLVGLVGLWRTSARHQREAQAVPPLSDTESADAAQRLGV